MISEWNLYCSSIATSCMQQELSLKYRFFHAKHKTKTAIFCGTGTEPRDKNFAFHHFSYFDIVKRFLWCFCSEIAHLILWRDSLSINGWLLERNRIMWRKIMNIRVLGKCNVKVIESKLQANLFNVLISLHKSSEYLHNWRNDKKVIDIKLPRQTKDRGRLPAVHNWLLFVLVLLRVLL